MKKLLDDVAVAFLAGALALAGCSGSSASAPTGAASASAAGGGSSESLLSQTAPETTADSLAASSALSSALETPPSSQGMKVTVDGRTFEATFADTKAASEFRALLPLEVRATELNGNEKYAELDRALSTDGEKVVSRIQTGDIYLYDGNDVVLFYETHSNSSWSYVPIAHIDDASGLADAVGSGDVTIAYGETE